MQRIYWGYFTKQFVADTIFVNGSKFRSVYMSLKVHSHCAFFLLIVTVFFLSQKMDDTGVIGSVHALFFACDCNIASWIGCTPSQSEINATCERALSRLTVIFSVTDVLVCTKLLINKKVLLRERKRHTARRVASTPYVVLTGYPPQAGYLPWAGYPPPPPGYPPGWTWQGTPPPPAAPWHSGKCCKALWDTGTPPPPPWTDRLMDGWKDRRVSKHYLPVVLRTRAVTSETYRSSKRRRFKTQPTPELPPK